MTSAPIPPGVHDHQSPSPSEDSRLREYLARAAILPAHLVRSHRTPIISDAILRAGPWLRQADQELIGDLGLLIYAMDDLVDEAQLSEVDVAVRLDRWVRVLFRPSVSSDDEDQVSTALKAFSSTLKKVALTSADLDAWSQRFRQMIDGMRWARSAYHKGASARTPAALGQYIAHGTETIGLRLVLATVRVLARPSCGPRTSRMDVAERHLALALRIANDLATYERECGEMTVNVLTFTGVRTRNQWLRRIDAEIRAAEVQGLGLPPAELRLFDFARRFTQYFVELYDESQTARRPGIWGPDSRVGG